MVAPLEGIRVLEVANWVAAPSCAALMADMGADVVKVEPPGGDALRGIVEQPPVESFPGNLTFELDNRGKRSIVIDMQRPGGAALVRRLAAGVDVFVTNLTQPRAERFGLTFEQLRRVNPQVVYSVFSGYGTSGPDAARRGFDFTSFWAHSGIQSVLGEPPSPPPLCRRSQGDHTSALNLLAATLAALRLRDATGEAQRCEVALQRTGMWTIAGDVQRALVTGEQPPRHDRVHPSNPIFNSYPTSDDRWVMLAMAQTDRYWGRFCQMLERVDWAERYPDFDSLLAGAQELAPEIERRFREHDLAYWGARLDEFDLTWAPVAELPEVVRSPQLRHQGAFAAVAHPAREDFETIAAPFSIDGADVHVRGRAPEPGEHSHEVLRDFGLEGKEIADLAAAGTLG